MYNNSTAQIRPDLCTAVEEGMGADKLFLAEKLLPTKFSKRKNGYFHKLTKSASGLLDTNLGDSTRRAPKSPYKEVDRTYSKDTFDCLDRGLKEAVDDAAARETAPSFDQEAVVTRLLTRNIRLAQEARVKGFFFNTTNFPSPANPAVNYTEANIATIDFAQDIQNAIAKVQKRGEMVTDIVLNRPVWNLVRRTTLLRKFLFGDLGGGQKIDLNMLGSAFNEYGAIQFHIGETSYNIAKKGQAVSDSTLDYIWPSTYIWVGSCVKDTGSEALAEGEIASFSSGVGVNFVWEEDASGLYVVESYRDEDRRSDMIRVRQHNTEKLINGDAGTLVTTNFA